MVSATINVSHIKPRAKRTPALFIAGVRLGLEADFRVQLGVFAQRQLQVIGRASTMVAKSRT